MACNIMLIISTDTETIEQGALRLPLKERAHLAQKLLLSLDTLTKDEISESWLDEAVDRAGELEEGVVTPIPASEVWLKAQKLLR
jgi:hypothetical protein